MSPRSDWWLRGVVVAVCLVAMCIGIQAGLRPTGAEEEPSKPTSRWTVHKVSSFWSTGPEVWLIREEVTGRTWLHSVRGGLVEIRP